MPFAIEFRRRDHPHDAGEVRGRGLRLGIEFIASRAAQAPVDVLWGRRLSHLLRNEGILGNYFNGALVLYPPLNITTAEANFLVQGIVRALRTRAC